MYEVIIREHFSAAHQLRDFDGICENLHGHNWKVEVVIVAEKLNSIGVVVDFSVVEKYTKEVIDIFDHQVLNEIPYFHDFNPSAENISRFVFEELKKKLSHEPVQVKKVTIWETDNLGASYYGRDKEVEALR